MSTCRMCRHNKNKNDRIKFVTEPNNGGWVNKTVENINKYVPYPRPVACAAVVQTAN